MAEFDLGQPHWLAIVEFNLAEHKDRMGHLHPDWSERQRACCLYWQGTVRKCLRETCEEFTFMRPERQVNYCPEAMGVDLFKTCEVLGIELERNPKELVYKIALIGYPNAK
jgi:hypothetical protein